MRSRGGSSSALGAERAERERERAALLRHARDEAERSLQLAAALSARDTQLRHAREQLFEVHNLGLKIRNSVISKNNYFIICS